MSQEKNDKPITEGQQSRAYAAYYGLWVGLCWVASFLLSMYGLSHPMASTLGFFIGLCSLPFGTRLLHGFREQVAPLPLRRAWNMAWQMFLCAALLCAASQYVYFAYFDNGLLLRTYTDMLEMPEMQEMLTNMLPGQDGQAMMTEALNVFATTPPSQLAIQFLFWNALLATFFAFPVALFSFSRPQNIDS